MHYAEIVYNPGSLDGVNLQAKVAELVDALDLGSCGATRESSSLSFRTRLLLLNPGVWRLFRERAGILKYG